MNVKDGVKFSGVKKPLLEAIAKIYDIMEATGEYTITSVSDGTHKPNSLHYKGLAMDLRSKHIPEGGPNGVEMVAERLRLHLGPDFDVVYEGAGTPNAHLHVEWDKD